MGIFKLMIAATIASALLLGFMPAKALADTSAIQQEEVCETTTGFYGQTSTRCIQKRTGVPVVKKLEDTGLDTTTLSLISTLIAFGALALVAQNKLRA